MKISKRNTAFIATSIATVALGLFTHHSAQSHPHDLLAQCQLPDGTWKMCDEVKHKFKNGTGPHVNQQKLKRPSSFKAAPKSTRNQAAGLSIAIPFSTTCANGFSKAGEKKFGNGDMDWYVCSTPVLTCPSYTQKNGKKAHVTPKAIVQMIGANPDGGAQKFRVQYKCDYSHNAVPVG
ncbi:MAG: hypothetical protein ACRBBR_06020 [Cellvibrionaceae bacterium]